MKKGLKTILIVVGVLVIAIVIYSVLSGGGEEQSTGLVSTNSSQPVTIQNQQVSGFEVGQEFVSLLLSLRGISLDTNLFQDPAFQSLDDKTVLFQDPGGEGRPNPFAPIGVDETPEPVETPEETPVPAPTPGLNQNQPNENDPFGGFDADADA
jgi:hypothetical protein